MTYEEEEEEQQIEVYEEPKEKPVKTKNLPPPGAKSREVCRKCLYPEFSCQCLNVKKDEEEE